MTALRLAVILLILTVASAAAAPPATLSVQGVLRDAQGGIVANGMYTVTFRLHDAAIDGTELWSETHSLAVMDGVWSAVLGETTPLGTLGFDAPYYLSLEVQGENPMTPRIPLTASAYAFLAGAIVDSAVTAATIADGVVVRSLNGLTGNVVLAAGSNVSLDQIANTITINAAAPGTMDSTAWKLGGNVLSDPAAQYLGSANDSPVELRAGGLRALRLEPGVPAGSAFGTGRNLLGGSEANTVDDGVVGATIAGGGGTGGSDTGGNRVSAHYGTIGGGAGHLAGGDSNDPTNGPFATVSGGKSNQALARGATVGGGEGSIAADSYATVAGGNGNQATGFAATVPGGNENTAGGPVSTVGGGQANTSGGDYSTVAGGYGNAAGGTHAAVSGGNLNTASGNYASVSGGDGNTAGSSYAAVAGGMGNTVTGTHSVIAGGESNTVSAGHAVIAGGGSNTVSGLYAFIGGGILHQAAGYSVIGGGSRNKAVGDHSIVVGGTDNAARGDYAAILSGGSATFGDTMSVSGNWAVIVGGRRNLVNFDYGVVLGGTDNEVTGSYGIAGGEQNRAGPGAVAIGGAQNEALGTDSWAGGSRAKAANSRSFVWGSKTAEDFSSTTSEQFLVRADGGVGIGTSETPEALNVLDPSGSTGIRLGGGGTNGPHGLVFEDDTAGAGVQLFWRTGNNQLVLEKSSQGTGTDGVDAFSYDRDNDHFVFNGEIALTGSINAAASYTNHIARFENSAGGSADVMALRANVATPSGGNNFITFFGSAVDGIGAIEGDGAGGVTLNTSGADYAEWLRRAPGVPSLGPGTVVGVREGMVSLRTEGADQVMVISTAPIVLGNRPAGSDTDAWERVAFLGQIPVRVRGPVRAGDCLVASGHGDGRAVGVPPVDMTAAHWARFLGVAWGAGPEGSEGTVPAVIGLPAAGIAARSQEAEIASLRDRLSRIENRLARLEGTADKELGDE